MRCGRLPLPLAVAEAVQVAEELRELLTAGTEGAEAETVLVKVLRQLLVEVGHGGERLKPLVRGELLLAGGHVLIVELLQAVIPRLVDSIQGDEVASNLILIDGALLAA